MKPSGMSLCNAEAESSVLGSLLVKGTLFEQVREIVQADAFSSDTHRAIFQAMERLAKSGKPIDLVSVNAELAGQQAPYLAELAADIVAPSSGIYHAEVVRDYSLRRRALDVAHEIQESAKRTQEPLSAMIEETTAALASISNSMVTTDTALAYDVGLDVMRGIQSRRASRGHLSGVPTGYDDLDRMTNGLQPSDLIILAARPSMGKTALALNIALRSAERGNPAAFFSLEMSKESLVQRALCTMARVDSGRVRSGYLSDGEMNNLMDAAERIKTAQVHIDETGGIRVLELKAKARRLVKQHGVKLIIVDYVGLVRCDAKRDSREQEVAYISSELKSLAKELRVPVLCLSQLNREVEKRKEKRPGLSDLRESGSLEQDADMVWFLYNDTYYRSGNVHPADRGTETEVIIAKHRNGPCGTVGLAFFAPFVAFENQAAEGW